MIEDIENNLVCFDLEQRLFNRESVCRGVVINLQNFADEGDKTEKATAKKRQKSREKGQVLQSKELTSSLLLTILFATLKILGSYFYKEISSLFTYLILDRINEATVIDIPEFVNLYSVVLYRMFRILGPFLAVAVSVSFLTSYAQVGSLFTLETLKPSFSKLNPINGFKRMFSIKSLVELVKSIVKILIVGMFAYNALKAEIISINKLMDLDIISVGGYICSTALNVALKICAAFILLSLFDLIYQWWQYEKDLKMSKQEVKDEYKETEGNPQIKQQIRRKQREISMRRQLSDVPQADVIITNPTHFAVAIKYNPEEAEAPIVLAKGQDFLAFRIREIAKENGIEIVENKPLAQALYKTCEPGQEISPDLYEAVAGVLAFVFKLKGKSVAK